MQTIHDFIRQNGVTLTSSQTARNPSMEGGERMTHWKCKIKCGKASASVVFSMGSGHNGQPPKAADVLSSMAMDASSAENAKDWQDFAREFGWETTVEDPNTARIKPNAKAKNIYVACLRERDHLVKLFGPARAKELMYETEQL